MRKFCIILLMLFVVTAALAQSRPVARPQPKAPAKASVTAAQPRVVINTTAGKISCTLFPDKAPQSVANFIGLAKGTKDWTDPKTKEKKHGVPLYNGTIFHRVIPGFMIQGGDPIGTGEGDPGYGFGLEVTPELKFDRSGRLAYARTQDPNTNGSQFFITAAPTPRLDMKYTIFGQCENPEVVQTIINAPRNSADRPDNPTTINSITVLGSKPRVAGAKPAVRKPAPKKPASTTPNPSQKK